MVLMLGGCAESGDEASTSPPSEPTQTNPAPIPPTGGIELMLEASTDKVDYLPGEQVKIEISVHNPISRTVIVSPFPPEMEISSKENQQLIRSFIPESNEVQFEGNETKTFSLTWDQKDTDGNQVVPGYYRVYVYTDVWEALGDGGRTGIGKIPMYIFVKHPQGAMEKIIEVNQSQAIVDMPLSWGSEELLVDINITLERVELSAEEAEFIVFATLKEWGKPQDIYTHPLWWGNSAGYNVDGVYHSLPGAGMTYLQDGIRYFWKGNPIPGYTQELIFVMNRLSEDWEGPWEFQVPLD